jgi:hypothetical protein
VAGKTEFAAGVPNTLNPKVKFSQLRKLLLGLGFAETITPRKYTFFAHAPSGAEFAMPIYRANRIVLPHHLGAVRMMLDATGVMDSDEFDEAMASASSTKQPDS